MNPKVTKKEELRYEQLQLMALDFARNGETIELEKMIKAGIKVNLSTNKDDTLLMLSTYNGNLETSQMLINYKADIDRINQRGQTPLEGVCFKGNLDIVKLLVKNGANIQGKAIIYASMFGHKNIVSYLKNQGLDRKYLKIIGVKLETITVITSFLKNLFKKKKKILSQ